MTTIPKFIGVLVMASLLIAACTNTPFSSQPDTIPVTGAESASDSQEEFSDQAVEEDGIITSCFDVTALTLQADHTLTINQPDTKLTHILKQGGIALIKSSTIGQGDYDLSTISPQALGYEVIGTIGDCSLDASGTMLFSAKGYCQDGVVFLSITEDWQQAGGTMICDDTQIPFEIPGFNAAHTGLYGTGEEFLLTNDPSGFTVTREFQGGEGVHSWTLSTDIGTVPLVPDGE